MPLVDYECNECGHEQKDVWIQNYAMEVNQRRECPYCKDVVMAKKASAPSFTVSGYSAANGYSRKEG